jgi:hypothetical protein
VNVETTTWTASAADLVREGYVTSASLLLLLLATLAIAALVTMAFLTIRHVRHPRRHHT